MKAKCILLFFFSCSVFSFFEIQGQTKETDSRHPAGIMAKWSKYPVREDATQNPVISKDSTSGKLNRETNLPRSGDQIIKLEASFIHPGQSGKEVIWDFNDLQLNGKEYPVKYFETTKSDLAGIENSSMQTYLVSGDSLLLKVHEDPSTLIRLEKPEEIMIFPAKFGDERTGYFYGKGKYCDRLQLDVTGVTYSKVDGSGTLILPENDTLLNVTRVYTEKITSVYSCPITPGFDLSIPRDTALSYHDVLERLKQDTTYQITETYRWYAEGNRYPVLETVQTSRIINGESLINKEIAYIFHPIDQQELPEDKANLAILDKNNTKKPPISYVTGKEKLNVETGSIKTYPNPVANYLNISLKSDNQGNAQVFLYSLQGQLVYKNNFQVQSGNHEETLDMSRLAKGSYILKVQVGDKSEKKVIIKQ